MRNRPTLNFIEFFHSASRRCGVGIALVASLSLCVPQFAYAKDTSIVSEAASDDGQITIIVQLSDEGLAIDSENDSSEVAEAEERHESVKAEIRDEIEGSGNARSRSSAEDTTVEDVDDYYHIFDGFAITAPADALESIKQIDGVENAFISHEFKLPDESTDNDQVSSDGSQTVQNQSALDMLDLDGVEQTGKGMVVAVIDSAFDLNHEAFSGAMDENAVALHESDVEELKTQLDRGAYVNTKVPFVHDYADDDDDVSPVDPTDGNFSHGTHVAGTAVANGGQIRGVAPDAQLVAMKVMKDKDATIAEDAMLSAMEDCAIIKPAVVNMSLGVSSGFSDDFYEVVSSGTHKMEEAGIVVNSSAGNDGSYASESNSHDQGAYNTDPDIGTIGSPGSLSSSLAIASVQNFHVSQQDGHEYEDNYSTPDMSSFSSWGSTPGLTLKPDLTAPGGNIYSSVPDNRYATYDGTSMAAPHSAGAVALVRQYVDQRFPSLSDQEKRTRTTQLLMSTAVPIMDPSTVEDESVKDAYYSPRRQGAGLIAVKAAMTTDVYETVTGTKNADVSYVKAELGDSADGTWNYTVTLHNAGETNRSFTVSAMAMSQHSEGGFIKDSDRDWTDEGIDVAFSGDYDSQNNTVTVPAGGEASFTVTVACAQTFKDWAAENMPNGAYVEGYSMLTSTDGGVNLSAPFMGFYGDWSAAPLFDANLNQGDHMTGSFVYGGEVVTEDGSDSTEVNYYMGAAVPLGINPFDDDGVSAVGGTSADYSAVDVNKLVVSKVKGYSKIGVQTRLLRNATKLEYSITDVSGKTEYNRMSINKGIRRYTSKMRGISGSAEQLNGLRVAFDCTDKQGNRLPDGTYVMHRTGVLAGTNKTDQAPDLTFQIDTKGPEITNATYDEAGGTWSFDVTDSSWLAAWELHDPSNDKFFYRVVPDAEPTVNENGKRTWHVTLNIADVKQAWAEYSDDELPDMPVLYAWDYGMNSSKGVAFSLSSNATESRAETSVYVISEDGETLLAYNGGVTNIEVPEGIKHIGDRALQNCRSHYVALPEGLETIGKAAFKGSDKVADFKFPTTLKSIGDEAFMNFNQSGIHSHDIVLPDGFETVGARAFKGSSFITINIGGAKTIGDEAFADLFIITDLNLRADLNRLESIGSKAFETHSRDIEWEGEATHLDANTIQELVLPDSLKTMSPDAFAELEFLEKLTIGSSLTSDLTDLLAKANKLAGNISVNDGSSTYSVARQTKDDGGEGMALYYTDGDGNRKIAYSYNWTEPEPTPDPTPEPTPEPAPAPTPDSGKSDADKSDSGSSGSSSASKKQNSAQVARTGSDVTFIAVLAIMLLGGSVVIMTRRRYVAGDC